MLSAVPASGGELRPPDDPFARPELAPEGELHLKLDRATGLRAIIAIHSTRLGPALGGCRLHPYPATTEAVTDALRLARGMSYKAALAGLPYGGGKAVLMRPSRLDDRVHYFETFGRFVEILNGRFITAEDVGTSVADMDAIALATRHVVGTSAGSGDPSPFTALGVCRGIEVAVARRLGRRDLAGLRVAIQGLGHVGLAVARALGERGAHLVVTDTSRAALDRAVAELGAEAVPPGAIYDVECEVFAPCAMGACLDDRTIPRLRAAVVAGSANNQLAAGRHADRLHRRGILFCPDYVLNAGGLIRVALAHGGAGADEIRRRILGIGDTLDRLFRRAEREGRPPVAVADALAEERLYG